MQDRIKSKGHLLIQLKKERTLIKKLEVIEILILLRKTK